MEIAGLTNEEIEQGEGSWIINISGDVDDLDKAMK